MRRCVAAKWQKVGNAKVVVDAYGHVQYTTSEVETHTPLGGQRYDRFGRDKATSKGKNKESGVERLSKGRDGVCACVPLTDRNQI